MNKLKLICNILIISFICLMFSCSNGLDCFKKSGKTIIEERQFGYIKSIELNDLFDVYLQNDTVDKITIETGENIISKIKTTYSDSSVSITNTGKCRFAKGYGNFPKLTIHLKNREQINLQISEACNIYTIDTFKIKNFYFINTGDISKCDITINVNYLFFLNKYSSGNYVIKGIATNFESEIVGTSFVNAKECKSTFCGINSATTGDCYFNVSSKLWVSIHSSGNIYYKGDPDIEIIKKESTGKIIKIY